MTESIFENRFKYMDELARMGASVRVEGNTAIITGVERLTGARVSAPDLRAGAALVIAALAADGITVVDDIVYICLLYTSYRFQPIRCRISAALWILSRRKRSREKCSSVNIRCLGRFTV